ncbi:hypothetical protein BDY19DRAFT_463629 [Irpex rosettiformis]|uniref:Uncharacterized protein n=1 Tax=Irpex rosettiformis TaxID=378272 RepID=A0ACB8TSP8_9APHY|nr:hypothetical protein BDY19DRAFT_463629 [Irpex rosettiformis]
MEVEADWAEHWAGDRTEQWTEGWTEEEVEAESQVRVMLEAAVQTEEPEVPQVVEAGMQTEARMEAPQAEQLVAADRYRRGTFKRTQSPPMATFDIEGGEAEVDSDCELSLDAPSPSRIQVTWSSTRVGDRTREDIVVEPAEVCADCELSSDAPDSSRIQATWSSTRVGDRTREDIVVEPATHVRASPSVQTPTAVSYGNGLNDQASMVAELEEHEGGAVNLDKRMPGFILGSPAPRSRQCSSRIPVAVPAHCTAKPNGFLAHKQVQDLSQQGASEQGSSSTLKKWKVYPDSRTQSRWARRNSLKSGREADTDTSNLVKTQGSPDDGSS